MHSLPLVEKLLTYLRVASDCIHLAVPGFLLSDDFGRLGPNHVTFDIRSNVGAFIVNKDRLAVRVHDLYPHA